MKKCSVCRKENKELWKCFVLVERWHGYRANPDFKINQLITKVLCPTCLNLKYCGHYAFPLNKLI